MQPRIEPSQLIVYIFIFVAAPTLTFFIGSWLDTYLGFPLSPPFPLNIFTGMGVMIIGLNLGIKSTRQLYHAGFGLPWGEAVHSVETQRLVVNGIYRYSRNPMVLGYSLLPMGMGLMFQSIGMAFSITPMVLALNYLIVKTREEPRLAERFGDEYHAYKEKTPFLFPKSSLLIRDYLFPYVSSHREQLGYVLLAETSLLVTSLLVFQDMPEIGTTFFSSIADLVFIFICFVGIVAGLFPGYCSFTSKTDRYNGESVEGHHPNCALFSGHVVAVNGRRYCAGCSGLVIGALLALLGLLTGFYPLNTLIGFWFGVLLVGLGLAQHFIDLGSGWIHLWLNIGFVIGDWLMFEAIQLLNFSFLVSIYFLAVTIFWIYARIRASQWTHVSVCRDCDVDCLMRF